MQLNLFRENDSQLIKNINANVLQPMTLKLFNAAIAGKGDNGSRSFDNTLNSIHDLYGTALQTELQDIELGKKIRQFFTKSKNQRTWSMRQITQNVFEYCDKTIKSDNAKQYYNNKNRYVHI